MSGPQTPSNSDYTKAKYYFVIGAILLLMMGLFSAVDRSIVYILLGAAVYFFFLGFNSFPRNSQRTSSGFTGRHSRPDWQSARDIHNRPPAQSTRDFWSQFEQIRNKFSLPGGKQNTNTRAIRIFLVIFSAAFIVPIFVSIFNGDSPGADAMYFYDMGEQQYNAGQYDSAYLYYKKSLNEDPEFEEALLGYGKVFSAREQCDSAVIMYDRVLELDPDHRAATYYKAYCYYAKQKYTEGRELAVSLIEKNPDYYDAMLLLGDFYYAEKKNSDALAWYTKAYEEGGVRSLNLSYLMAYLYDIDKNYEKAIPLYQEALTYDSTQVDIYKRLGELLADASGDYYRSKAAQLK